MKKLFTLLIVLLIWAGSSWAAVITIGTGTSTQRQPFGMYWGYERSASIYTQAEITTFGTITTIGWYVGTAQTTNCPTKIYLKTTTATTLTAQTWATMISGATLVYDVTRNYTPTGWLTIDITDFTYSSDNLLVLCETNYGGGGTTSYPVFQYSTATNQHEIWYADNAPPAGSGTVGSLRPNIQFDIGAITGPLNPTAFTATAFSSSQINLSWALNANGNAVMLVWNSTNTFGTPANGTPYIVGQTVPGGGTVLQNNTGTSYNHTPLSSNTPYFYKAYSVAAGNTYSSGASASATTLCDVYPQITEDFELTAFPPACWSLVAGSGNWARTTAASGYGSGLASALANFYNISGATPFELISPEFSAAGALVSFDHAYATYETENDQLLIFYSTNGGSSYTLLITLDGGLTGPLNTGGATLSPYTPAASEWASKSYALPAGTNKVKFQAISAFGNNLYLDNIFIGTPPSVDLRFNQFYQSTGLPIPLNMGVGSDFVVKNKMGSGERQDYLTTLSSDIIGVPASEGIYTMLVPDINRSPLSIMLADIQVTAEIENIGLDPASYNLSWEVDGISQTPYSGPVVNPGDIHSALLTYPSPPARGTFMATGDITVVDDANPGNNSNEFRLRVYPDVYSRTIYDRGDNTVDTYVGWNSATITMKAGVRYTAADYIKPVGVDFICRTETVSSGTYTVEVRAAGTTNQAPGDVLYTISYTNSVFFSAGGDYMHFAFDENLVPTIAPGSDYWITIEAPLGVLFPGAAHGSGFTAGRSFYYVASTDSWTPLVLSLTEYAWIMRSVHVQGDIPSCPVPTNQTVSNITPVGAVLDWDYAVDSFFDIFTEVSGGPAPGPGTVPTASGIPTTSYTWTGGQPNTTYDWYVRTDCGFTAPKVDYFWLTMTTPGNLLPSPASGGTANDPLETGIWYNYVNAPGDIDWWNIWFYNDPLDPARMKKIRMGFWIQKLDPALPANLYYVVNWSNSLWPTGTGFPTPSPSDETFIERSPVNELMGLPAGNQWIELSYIIADYNPEWISVDIWGENIQILEESPMPPPPNSPLFAWWVPGSPGGIIVHECLPKPLGNNSDWVGPVTFSTTQIPASIPFGENFETWPDGWTVENGTETNQWAVGSATSHAGAQSAYISNDGGVTNFFDIISPSVVHLYRDIAFTGGTAGYTLKFWWLGQGESCCDYLKVFLVDPSTIPVAGTQLTTGQVGVNYNLQGSWVEATISLPGTVTGSTKRLVLSWRNDNSIGTQPPAAVDDLSIIAIACPLPTDLNTTGITDDAAFLDWNGPIDSFFDIFFAPGSDPFTGSVVSGVTPPYTVSGLDPQSEYSWAVRTDCGFTEPKVDNFWMAMTGPGMLDPLLSGGFTELVETGEDMTWWEYPDAPGYIDWWNIWFYNDPLNMDKIKKIRMGFWVQPLAEGTGQINYVINWSNSSWNIPGQFPDALQEEFIMRSAINGPIIVNGLQWVELYYVIPDYNPEWISVDIWGENIIIENSSMSPPPGSPLLPYWKPTMNGGIIVHECLPETSMSTWVGPVSFTTGQLAATLPFTENFETLPNNWVIVNGTQPNKWVVGDAVPYNGTKSAYISDDNGVSNNYDVDLASTAHIYRDIAFTGGPGGYTLKFWWKGIGETVVYDRMRVYLVETSVLPVAGTALSSGQIGLANYNGQSTWVEASIDLPGAITGTTKRLVLSWVNDGIFGEQPPIAVDDLTISVGFYIWEGDVSSAWNDPNNWNQTSVPDASSNVIIPVVTGSAVYPVILNGQTVNCGDLLIQTGAAVNVEVGGFLNVKN